MIADRQGPQPRHIAVRFAGRARPQSAFRAAARAYLLLIDRENPLSSLPGRR